MTLSDLERRNGPYFAFFSRNSIALLAKYITVVDDRSIMSVKYCLPVPVFHFWPLLTRPAAQSLCNSWATCFLNNDNDELVDDVLCIDTASQQWHSWSSWRRGHSVCWLCQRYTRKSLWWVQKWLLSAGRSTTNWALPSVSHATLLIVVISVYIKETFLRYLFDSQWSDRHETLHVNGLGH